MIQEYSNLNLEGNPEVLAILTAHKLPRGIESYVKENVFKNYIIYDGKTKKGFCTNCERMLDVPYAEHNGETRCPRCKMEVTYKSKGLRKTMVEYGSILIFFRKEKSIHIITSLLRRDTSIEWQKIIESKTTPIEFSPTTVYSLDGGRQSMYEYNSYYGWGRSQTIHLPQWLENRGRVVLHMPSFLKSLKGSCLQYAQVEQFQSSLNFRHKYGISGLIKFMAINAKYPQVEYLNKLGFHDAVDTKLWGGATYKALDWRKKNLKGMFNLETADIKLLQGINATLREIATYKRCLKEGWRLKLGEEIREVAEVIDLNGDREILSLMTVKAWYHYRQKMIKQGTYKYSARSDYKDYLKEMKELNYNISDEYNLFPPNFKKAHEKVSALYRTELKRRSEVENEKKIKEKEKQDEILREYAQELQEYSYEAGELLIRPAGSFKEFVVEGDLLHHCIAGYYEDMTKKRNAIFFIRKKSEPDNPYYTLELKDKKVNQCRGLRNCGMTDDVKAFVDKWYKKVILAKPKKSKKERKVA